MKCPKCGYNSFDDNDFCPKCANDLVKHKQAFGIASVVLSPARRADLLAEVAPPQVEPASAQTVIEAVEITEAAPEKDIFATEPETPEPAFEIETTSFSSNPETEKPAEQKPQDFIIETMEHFHNPEQKPEPEPEPSTDDENPFAFLETTTQEAQVETTLPKTDNGNPFADLLETTRAEDTTTLPLPEENDFLQELNLDTLSFAEEQPETPAPETKNMPSAEDELASLFGELDLKEK
ncbi:MAG: zinc ribbon domain-containing protein [Trichlorobacter sp.]|nr:zinc ribbon domain-containing protein [Trichlorobacter sp.]